jgi:hypothetical protein
MTMEPVLSTLRALDGVLELAPKPGSEHPELSWGDHFFYYSPTGEVPLNRQPYATIVTKDYPDDSDSRLSEPERWRVNVHVGSGRAAELTGALGVGDVDYAESDAFLPHPLYGDYGWIAVVNPGGKTMSVLTEVLRAAHEADRRRVQRRRAESSGAGAGL